MAATTIASLITQVRAQLVEPTARFWDDDELAAIMNLGGIDLWGAVLDLHQDYYLKINKTDVYYPANTDRLSGIPADCFRVQLIEPLDTSSQTTGHQVMFMKRKYKDSDFTVARTQPATDPGTVPGRTIYYQMSGEGSPLAAPEVLCAPPLSADLRLRLAYNPFLSTITADGTNPVPGGSDNALKAWTIAYARAKETEDREPDAGWLAVYASQLQRLLVRMTPRDESEPDVAEDMFQGYGHNW